MGDILARLASLERRFEALLRSHLALRAEMERLKQELHRITRGT